MKVHIRQIRHKIKRVLAGVLSSALLLTSLPANVFAEEVPAGQSEYDAIMKVLAEEDPAIAEQYPAGLFKFDTLIAQMSEDSKEPLKLYVVRHGGTQGEVTVNVKFSDYSARYGKDYTARLEGAEEDIAANPESQPILYMLGSGNAEEKLQNAYGSYDAMVETLGQEKVDRMEALVNQYQEDKAKEDEAASGEALIAEESPLYQLNEQVSQYAQDGVDTENVWVEQQSMDAATAKLSWGMMEEVFPGTEVDVTFADGEQIKEITVTPINNDTSDGERIFSVILNDISNENSGIDSDNTVSVTMYDDEASALSKIRVDTDSLPEVINAETGTFSVRLLREEALYNLATANFYAVTDNNVVLMAGKVIFMPGMEEQTVEIDAAKVAGASNVNLYFDAESTMGCEAAGSGSIRVSNGEEDGVQAMAETSGIVYTAKDSPIGFAGEGTYSGFDIYPSDENFVAGSDTAGKQHKSTRNSYNSGEKYWDLYIPDASCTYKNQRIYMQSKWSFSTFNYISSLDVEAIIDDQEPSTCNRIIFSTNDNYNIGYTDEDEIDDLGGVWRFAGDFGGGKFKVKNDGSGAAVGILCKSDEEKIGTMGTHVGDSVRGGKLKFAAWKTSGGVNGPYMKLYNVHVNYKQFHFHIVSAEKGELDGEAPGALRLVSRDGTSSGTDGIRYALEKFSFIEEAPNENYVLKGMQIQAKDGSWINISSKYFNAEQRTLTLKDTFYSDYKDAFDANAAEYSKVMLRPVYQGRPITVTINTDEHGGVYFDGRTYKANTGSHNVSVNAGKTVTFYPTDVRNGWYFTKFDGSKAQLDATSNTYQVDFQQNQEKQTMKLEAYNYVITPIFTEAGTNVKVNVKGSVPSGCQAPDVREFSLKNGNLEGAGQLLQFQAKVADGYRAVWTVTTRDHTWQNRKFYGEYFDYSVINGDNVIELSFEKVSYEYYTITKQSFPKVNTGTYGPSFTAINGQVLGYTGTILNPPQRNGSGGYTGKANPIANAVVSMGNYTTRTDENGNFRLYSREEDADGDGINEQHYIRAYANEDHTIRVTCNNRTQIYVVNTGSMQQENKSITYRGGMKKKWIENVYSEDSANPYECSLTKSVTTDFYGNGPTPKDFYVLIGKDDETLPTEENKIAAVPMSNTTIGFLLKLDHITEKEPVSRVDIKIYDKDMNLRDGSTYSVIPDENGQCRLDEYPVYKDGVQTGTMFFNGLLNFHDGDQVYVDLIRTEYDAQGNPVDFSYGEYNTGVVFYEVPGQGLETVIPDVEAVAAELPTLDIVGNIAPGFSAGPLTVKAEITEDSMSFSVGFNVATFSKVANAKQLAEKARARAGTAEDQSETNQLLEDLDNEEITTGDLIKRLYEQTEAEGDPTAPMQPAPGVHEESVNIQEPTAEQMKDPSKFARQGFGESFQKNIKEAGNIIDKIKQGDSKSAALKDATQKTNGAIPVIINVNVGVTVKMVPNEQMKVWVFDSAMIYAQFSTTVTATFYMNVPAVPIPLYAGFSFTVSVGLYNSLQAKYMLPLSQMTGESGEFDPDVALGYSGSVPMTLAIEGFVGAGIRKLLALELGAGFVQQFNFGFGDGSTNNVGVGMTTFYGYVEVSLVIFNARWKYAQASWQYMLYNTSPKQAQQAQAISALNDTVEEAMEADLSELTFDKTQYASTFVGGNKMRSTLQQEHTDTILEDVPNMESQIIPLENGKAFMVYEGVDNNRDEYNRNAVYYTFYDGAAWSAPKLLQDDGTLDMGLTLEDMGDNFVISWSSAQQTYQESDFTDGTHTDEDGNTTVNSDALLKLLSSMDVYAIVLNKADMTDAATAEQKLTSATRQITKDTAQESQTTWGFAHENPNAVELEDGRILLFYTSVDYNTYGSDEPISSLNDLLSAPGLMMYRIYENGEWSEEYYSTETAYQGDHMKEQWYGQRVADINLQDSEGNIYYPITGYADVTTVDRNGEEMVLITYVVDTDKNISTSTDRIVCMSVMTPPSEENDSTTSLPIQLSTMGIPVSHTQFQKAFSQYGEIDLITFTQGNDLVYLDLTELFNGVTLSDQDREELGDSYTNEDTVGIVESTITVNGKEIPYYTLKDGVQPALAVKGDDKNSIGNGFAATSGEDGNVYLAWAQSDGEEQHMMVTALNVEAPEEGESGYQLKWSSPKKMSLRNADEETDPDAEGYEPEFVMNPSISVDENGNMMIIHNRFDMELETGNNEEGKEVAVAKHRTNNRLCVAFTKAVGSLEWLDSSTGEVADADKALTLSEEYPLAGTTFTASTDIVNKGLLGAEEIHVDAKLVTYDKDGNEIQSTDAKQLVKPDSLDIRLAGAVRAQFDMTQEMIDHAVNDGYKYKVVMDVWESNFIDQTISAEAEVKVGSRLELETKNINGFRTRKLEIGDDNKITIDDIYDGYNCYLIQATLRNTGNVDSAAPEVSLEMENQNAFIADGYDNKEMSPQEQIEYLENMPLNASLTNNEDFAPYIPISGVITEKIESIKTGESANITIASRRIPDSYYSSKGASTFILGVTDANSYDPENEIPHYVSFTETIGGFKEPRIRENEEVVYEVSMEAGTVKNLTVGSAVKEFGTYDSAVWSSSNESLVTVDENGTISATGEGVAVVTAAVGNREAKVRVQVLAADEEPPEETDPPTESEDPGTSEPPAGNEDPGTSEPPSDSSQTPGDGSSDDQNSGSKPDADIPADLTKNADKDTKKGAGVSSAAKTGDTANLRLWIILFCISGAAAARSVYKRRRKRRNQL